jgi:DHA1 family bicyclomycin/chloramphenicol resistance-like MFS transporter
MLLRKYDSARILPVVTALQSVTGILLLTGSLTGFVTKVAFVSIMVLFLFCFGFINPNCAAMALQPFSRNVGSASAIMGSTVMISGALASGLVSYFHSGTAVPMTIMMTLCPSAGFILVIIGQLFVRTHPQTARH